MAEMETLLRLALLAFGRAGDGDGAGSSRRTAITALAVIAAALLVAASIGCTAAALWLYGAERLGPSGGAFVGAGSLLVLSLVVIAVAAVMVHRNHRAPPTTMDFDSLSAELAKLFKDHKAVLLLAAVVAGLLLGDEDGKR
jgi:hypothetical protein